MHSIDKERAIRALVKTAVESFASSFELRHVSQKDNPDGVINMKIHNVFIAALGSEIQYYTALVRSLDSSLGFMLEALAINIAGLSYRVSRHVEGTLTQSQTEAVAVLLERYKRRDATPDVSHYAQIRGNDGTGSATKRHESDYYLVDEETGSHHLVELKIGGDLDNKKARSEKEALLEQYFILSNGLEKEADISIHFATAYNRYGEGNPWLQSRVRQYFCEDELLIGREFWNFIAKSENGYEIVLDEYRKNAGVILAALERIKDEYLD